jgi:hypothetical protein
VHQRYFLARAPPPPPSSPPSPVLLPPFARFPLISYIPLLAPKI